MKAVVFSDSHGDTAAMREALEREAPDQILHLGDLASAWRRLCGFWSCGGGGS